MKQLSNPRCMRHKYIDLFHYLFKFEKGPNQIAIKNVFLCHLSIFWPGLRTKLCSRQHTIAIKLSTKRSPIVCTSKQAVQGQKSKGIFRRMFTDFRQIQFT